MNGQDKRSTVYEVWRKSGYVASAVPQKRFDTFSEAYQWVRERQTVEDTAIYRIDRVTVERFSVEVDKKGSIVSSVGFETNWGEEWR